MPEGGAIVNTASLAANLWRKRAQQINEVLDLGISEGWAASLQWCVAGERSNRWVCCLG